MMSLEWQATLPDNTYADTVLAWDDGGLMVAGWKDSGASYLARVLPDGTQAWVASLPPNVWHKMAVDGAGHLYLAHALAAPAVVLGEKLEAPAYPASFLLKLDGDGKVLWSKVYDEGGGNGAATLAANASGVVLAGSYSVGLTIDDRSLVPGQPVSRPAYLVKLDADGNVALARTYGSLASVDTAVLNDDGSLLVGGNFSEVIGLGGETLGSSGAAMFFAKLDDEGNAVWARHFVGEANVHATRWEDGYALMARGALYDLGVGRWLGGQTVARLEEDGQIVWAKRLGSFLSYGGERFGAVLPSGLLVTGRTEDPPTDGYAYYPGSSAPSPAERELVALSKDGSLSTSMPLDSLEPFSRPTLFEVSASPSGEVVLGSAVESYSGGYRAFTTLRRVRVGGTIP
ncbi:MAG: hypothetical protein FJ095_08435 [Deltaproteobacteria bacterium]|nr:hypothetical protein [Deltaproteobacteria bacterium]